MRVAELIPADRRHAGLNNTQLALRVLSPVRPVTRAFKAGFRPNDIIVAFGPHQTRMSEVQLLAQVLQTAPPAEPVPVTVLRHDRRIPLKLPSQ